MPQNLCSIVLQSKRIAVFWGTAQYTMKIFGHLTRAHILSSFALGLAFYELPVIADTTILAFDDLKEGNIVVNYGGVSFQNNPTVVNVATEWKPISTITPENALYKSGAGPLVIDFPKNQGRVKVYVGNVELPGKDREIQLRAYSLADGKPALVATASTNLIGITDIAVPLEVLRPLDQDINRVEIEFLGRDYVVIDSLEFEYLEVAHHAVVTFDDLPVEKNYVRTEYEHLGVTFPDQVERITLFDETFSPAYAARNYLGEVENPGPMVMTFDPPQGIVRVRVGNQTSPLRPDLVVTLRAYSYYEYVLPPLPHWQLVGMEELVFPGISPISTIMEINRWHDQDISKIEVLFSNSEHEIIDQLEFAPNAPADPGLDTQAPRVIIERPANGQMLTLTSPYTPIHTTLSGRITESRVITNVTLVHDHAGTNISHRPDYLGFVVQNPREPTNYTFVISVDLYPGENRFVLTATDNSGMVSTGPLQEITVHAVAPEPLQVSSLTPTELGTNFIIRQNPLVVIPGSGDRLTLVGTNFHDMFTVYMVPSVVPTNTAPPPGSLQDIAIVGRSLDGQEVTLQVDSVWFRSDFVPSKWRIWVNDYWPGYEHWAVSDEFSIGEPPYPALYGFGFRNDFAYTDLNNFDSTYGNSGWVGIGDCKVLRPDYLLLFGLFKIVMDNIDGSCVGLAATSHQFKNGYLQARNLNGDVFYPSAFNAHGEEDHDRPWCLFIPSGPASAKSLWARIRGNHGVQLTAEFLDVCMDQMNGGGFSIDGNPQRVLATVASSPTDYVICMVPSVGKGHGVAPYKVVGNKIYVADCNKPFDVYNQSNPNNDRSTNSYIEIAPPSPGLPNGQYSFANLVGYVGTGLYAIPANLWNQRRTGPGLGVLSRFVAIATFGSADPQYTATGNASGRWGWDASGTFEDNLPGAKAVQLLGATENSRNVFFMLPSEYEALSIQANVRQQGEYYFHAAHGGRTLQVQVLNGHQGAKDGFNVFTQDKILDAFNFTPQLDGVRFVPKVSLTDGSEVTVFKWSGLAVPAGGTVGFKSWFSLKGASFTNLTGKIQHPQLLVESADANTVIRMLFGPLEIPIGAMFRTFCVDWPANRKLQAEIDLDGDGVPDQALELIGQNVSSLDNSSAPDCNLNGILDSVDIAFGVSKDANENGVPDECEGSDTKPRIELLPGKPGAMMFRVHGEEGANYVIEMSPDLSTGKWIDVFTGTAVNGTFDYSVTPTGYASFYRIRNAGAP
jgi:hypothetical protein